MSVKVKKWGARGPPTPLTAGPPRWMRESTCCAVKLPVHKTLPPGTLAPVIFLQVV